jgi:DNA-binding transcriptional regulator YdaS (Cro superfamily)
MTDTSAVETVIKKAGGQVKLAAAAGVTQQAVSHWLIGLRRIPAEYAKPIADKTGIPLHVIRPDLFPAPTGEDGEARRD